MLEEVYWWEFSNKLGMKPQKTFLTIANVGDAFSKINNKHDASVFSDRISNNYSYFFDQSSM